MTEQDSSQVEFNDESKRRVGGVWKGRVRMAEDFDEPLEDLENEIYGAEEPAS